MSQFGENPYYQGGGGGGGGYLAGGSPFGSSSGSPGGASRQRGGASHSLRPVTIKQLILATQAHSDAEWMIDDVEVAQVTVVAQVISIQPQTTNVVYWLDDGTGRIEARHWVDSAEEEGEKENWGGIGENMYIRVIGNLKSFGNKRYITATHLRPCQDHNEMLEHVLQVFYVVVVAQKGSTPPRPSDVGRAGTVSIAANGSVAGPSAYTAQAHNTAVNNQYPNLNPLQTKIVNFLLSQPRNEEGVHVAAIARHIGGEARAISEALDRLMDIGHVFSTIDESHFSVSV